MLFFTSISLNYLPKARVLAKSVKKYCPNSLFYLVLCDELPQDINIEKEIFDSIFFIKDLSLPTSDLKQWIFMHSVVELCTAVKGQCFVKFFENENIDKIIYLDPDTVVFDNLDELSKLLNNYSVILTPHLVEEEKEYIDIADNEVNCLKFGVFNLGFLAVKRNQDGIRFVKWWRDRLQSFCYDDRPNGLFTDQKWVDLAPALFPKVYILRDKAYNIAPWNITHRNLSQKEDGNYYIDEKRVKFYHFSGFDSGAYEAKVERCSRENRSLFTLAEWYRGELRKEEQDRFGKIPCIYSCFNNGEKVSNDHRRIYRYRQDLIDYFKDPFEIREDQNDYFTWYKTKRDKE